MHFFCEGSFLPQPRPWHSIRFLFSPLAYVQVLLSAVKLLLCVSIHLVSMLFLILLLTFLYFGGYFRKPRHVAPSSKKVVAITGCDTGFGYNTSLRLASEGFTVVACVLQEESVERLEGKVERVVVCDVTSEEDVIRFFQEVEEVVAEVSGSLWGVINNAGIAPLGLIFLTFFSLFVYDRPSGLAGSASLPKSD